MINDVSYSKQEFGLNTQDGQPVVSSPNRATPVPNIRLQHAIDDPSYHLPNPSKLGHILILDGTTGTPLLVDLDTENIELIGRQIIIEKDYGNKKIIFSLDQSKIDHLQIANNGVYTHANIDSHIREVQVHRPMVYSAPLKAIIYTETTDTFPADPEL